MLASQTGRGPKVMRTWGLDGSALQITSSSKYSSQKTSDGGCPCPPPNTALVRQCHGEAEQRAGEGVEEADGVQRLLVVGDDEEDIGGAHQDVVAEGWDLAAEEAPGRDVEEETAAVRGFFLVQHDPVPRAEVAAWGDGVAERQLRQTARMFWWSQQDKENKMHWLSWEILTKPKKEEGLGFRDLYGFNLAMLARQAWRILNAPESLCARLLKALYFPSTSILEAKPVAGMSYSWRSILKGVELLKEGVVWRIGDGTHVNIWSDQWLNRKDAAKTITPRGRCLLTRVSDLIDPVTNKWDVNLLRNNFWEIDVKAILATPLREDFEDYYAWLFEESGVFTVKSAYKLHVRLRDGSMQSSSNPELTEKFWKDVWKLECTPKIKQFIWRLSHNSLPLKKNLERRGVKCDTLCVCCGRLDEYGAHLFVKCKAVKPIWEALGLTNLRHRMWDTQSAKEMIEIIMKLDTEERILVCCLLWQWWSNRNKLNAKEKGRETNQLISQIRYWTSESLQYCRKAETNRTTKVPKIAKRITIVVQRVQRVSRAGEWPWPADEQSRVWLRELSKDAVGGLEKCEVCKPWEACGPRATEWRYTARRGAFGCGE
ncbi:hypothetical protein ACQ4PT_014329 [Festuca glaucescens]